MAIIELKKPLEPCPPDGWTIIGAMANCCSEWNETVTYSNRLRPDGTPFVANRAVAPIDMAACFGALKILCAEQLLVGFSRMGSCEARALRMDSEAWPHYHLVDGDESILKTAEGITHYRVKIFPADMVNTLSIEDQKNAKSYGKHIVEALEAETLEKGPFDGNADFVRHIQASWLFRIKGTAEYLGLLLPPVVNPENGYLPFQRALDKLNASQKHKLVFDTLKILLAEKFNNGTLYSMANKISERPFFYEGPGRTTVKPEELHPPKKIKIRPER